MRASLAQREPEKESYRVSTRVDRYWPRQRGLMLRPRASRTVALATGWKAWWRRGRGRLDSPSHRGGQHSREISQEPDGGRESQWLILLTSSAASPPTPHTQHRHVFRFTSTWKLGSWSSWNGHGQSKRCPCRGGPVPRGWSRPSPGTTRSLTSDHSIRGPGTVIP